MGIFQRLKWIGLSVLALLLFSSFYFYYPINKKFTVMDHQVIASTEVLKYENMSKYPGIELNTLTEEKEDYTISLSIPSIDAEKIHDTLQKWVEQEKGKFLEEINNLSKNKSNKLLSIRTEIRQHNDDIYGLTFYSYQYTGGANGVESVKSFVIDLNKDQMIKIDDFYPYSEKNIRKNLHQLFIEEVNQEKELEQFLLKDQLDDVFNDLEALEWAIDQDSLNLFFNPYEITTGEAGIVQINLPLETLEKNLKIVDEKEKEQERIERERQEAKEKEGKQKIIALTFDDGPDPDVTPQILDTLQEFNAKATFFMLGSQVEYYPKVAEQVANMGHEIASHSYNHPDLTKMDQATMHKEFIRTSEEIKKATGKEPKLFRPPYGAYDDKTVNYAKNEDYSIVLWSVDPLDWKHRDPNIVTQHIVNHLTDGAIVLLHDIHQSTADSLPVIIKALQDEGYTLVTVSELLEIHGEDGVGPFRGNDP